jgi:predicted nucleotidyltransferase
MGSDRNLVEVAEQFDCVLIYFFGSQADKGGSFLEGKDVKPDSFSDLDVAVVFRAPPTETIKVYGEIYKKMSRVLEPFDIDLVFVHELDPLFQYEIIKGVRAYEKDERLTEEFEEGVMKWAADLIVKKKMLLHEIMEAIEDGYFDLEYSANP